MGTSDSKPIPHSTIDTTQNTVKEMLGESLLNLKEGNLYVLPPLSFASKLLSSIESPLLYVGEGEAIMEKLRSGVDTDLPVEQITRFVQRRGGPTFLSFSKKCILQVLAEDQLQRLVQIKFFNSEAGRYMEWKQDDQFINYYLRRLDSTFDFWYTFCSEHLSSPTAMVEQVSMMKIHSNLVCIQLNPSDIHIWENSLLWKAAVADPSALQELKLNVRDTMRTEEIPASPEKINIALLNEETKLGAGSYGAVYLYQLRGQKVAVKVLSSNVSEQRTEFKGETSLAYKWRHRNVARALYLYDTPEKLMSVLELATTSLQGYLDKQLQKNNKIPPSGIWKLFADISLGMNYIHNTGVVHRDLSSGNFLLFEDWTLKVCDFGKSERYNTLLGDLSGVLGTEQYQSLESRAERYRKSSDIWSAGVILSIMCGISVTTAPKVRGLPRGSLSACLVNLTPEEKEIVNYWKEMIGSEIYLPLFVRNDCLQDTAHPFYSLIASCLKIEGSEVSRPTFSDLICSLEDMRLANKWDFSGNFSNNVSFFMK
jgi:tRNA A-37 threonylcarbamoyl transferase component Bud32